MEGQFIETIVILLGLATALAYFFRLLKLPPVLGYILTGVMIGPYGLSLIRDASMINAMAQIGILFLLFVLGLELSLAKLKQVRFLALMAGVLQLSLTTLILTLLFKLTGMSLQLGFLLGAILALSSTAIVLKSLEEIREIDTLHGRLILGMLVVQDLSIVPLMTLVPTFSSPMDAGVAMSLIQVTVKALLFLLLSVIISLKIIPWLLDKLAALNSKEIFTLTVVTLGLGMAYVMGEFGLSYEAGAFIAGLALNGSLYSKQAMADSKPFRDVFTTLFFVSVGLLVNLDFLVSHWAAVIGTTLVLATMKWLAAFGTARLMRFPMRTSMWVGFSLFQVGEFSFVLLRRTLETVSSVEPWRQMMAFWSPILVDAIVLTMFITPLAIQNLPSFLHRMSLGRKELKKRNHRHAVEMVPLPPEKHDLDDRVLIAGYGPIARNLVHALTLQGVPFTIVEMNANSLKKLKKEGHTCIFGDISHPDILKAAGVENARILILTFPDVRAAEVTLQHAKHLNPDIICVARARYRGDIHKLYALGADHVVYEEFESSVSFMYNVLHSLGHSPDMVQRVIGLVREREMRSMREILIEEQPSFGRLNLLADTKIEWLELRPGSRLVGKTLLESGIRQDTGVNVLSVINHEGKHEVNPTPELVLRAHDILVVVGTIQQLHKLEMLVA